MKKCARYDPLCDCVACTEDRAKKWEYSMRSINQGELISVLNGLGFEGWEVCGVETGRYGMVACLFKREVKK